MTDHKYVGFDIETSKVIPEGENLRDHRPLGISCVAFDSAEGQRVFAAKGDCMTPDEVAEVVAAMEEYIEAGYTIATWNGLAFDFDILAEESCDPILAKNIAEIAVGQHHVDLMFHFVCVKGFRCSLAKACEGMDIESKTEGMKGAAAPELWATPDGRAKVLEYVAQDARIQRLLTEAVDAKRKLLWYTQKGKLSFAMMGTPRSPADALGIPEPDTSWMDEPPKRSWFHWWTKQYGVKIDGPPSGEEAKVF